VKRWGNLCR